MADTLINNDGSLNQRAYNQQINKQREVFSKIDSTMACLEMLPIFSHTMQYGGIFPVAVNPLGFIFNILYALGVDEDTLIEWIVEILTFVLPGVEMGIKASLLANIKSLVSCNSDPRIPLYLRKKVYNNIYTNILDTPDNANRGIDINLDAIDPEGILDLSPFTEPGIYNYFGVSEEVENKFNFDGTEIKLYNNPNERVAKLVRADDMNAFIWYVVHKGNKQAPVYLEFISDGLVKYGEKQYTISEKTYTKAQKRNAAVKKNTILGVSTLKPVEGYSEFIEGTTFTCEKAPNTLSICVEAERDLSGNIVSNTIIEVSSDWYSCNWYVDKTNYYSSNLGIKKAEPRDYSKEKGIFNLRYYKNGESIGYNTNTYCPPNNLRFTILPKPYVLLPGMFVTATNNAEVRLLPIRLLFDAEGNADQNGKFSFNTEGVSLNMLEKELGDDGVLTIPINDTTLFLKVILKTGKYFIVGSNEKLTPNEIKELNKVLVECYPGLTVYEFNYDYIMGMKLFDPKVVCYNLFKNAANPRYGAYFGLSLNRLKDKHRYPYFAGKQRIIDIVSKILEENEEINDCFFSFSNKQYDEMLRKTEEIRYNQLPYNQGYNEGESVDFSEVDNILKDYPETGTLEEKKAVIRNAIEAACAIVDKRQGSNITALSDKSTVKIDFLTNILQQLVAELVNSLLSPKVLMLVMVNKILMGDEGQALSTEELLRMMENLIVSMIREIRDLIVKKLLDYIIQYLTPLALQLKVNVQVEQYDSYMAIIRLLLAWFNKGVETVGRLNSVFSALKDNYNDNESDIDLASVINNITYADIYKSDEKDNEPIINKC